MLRGATLLACLLLSGRAFAATLGGSVPVPLPLGPPNNWWNTDVSAAPLDPGSAGFITFIGPTRQLHPDFGGNNEDEPGFVYGIPFIVVEGSQPKKSVIFDFSDESDGVNHDTDVSFPFYPVPDEAITTMGWVENGPPGNVDLRDDGDRHILMLDRTNNTLYELYNVFYDGTQWFGGSGAFFDLNTNNRRPEGWTSADASGLAILPGLVRYDEATGPAEIRHAFRMTVVQTNGYVYPASHVAGSTTGALPMGARLRLKASKDISSYTPEMQRIFRAFKKYGLIVADNGSNMYISGTYDTRWSNDVLNPAFHSLRASDFEVVLLGWAPPISLVVQLPAAMGAGDPATATVTAYDANYQLATGYRGTIQFTSTDGAATLPANYTFTAGDAGTHVFSGGFTLQTAGSHVVTAKDVADATITGTAGVTVGPSTPTALVATAVSTTSVGLSWTASPGATQYEIVRATTPTAYAALTTTASTSFTDTTAAAGTSYLYKVRAVDASLRVSPFTAPDAATTILFTDDPLILLVTKLRVEHLTELRQAVNAMRTTAGLAAATFTDPSPAGVRVKAVHQTELRTALNAARSVLGLAALVYTDATLLPGTTVAKAAHVEQLRAGVK